MNAKKFIKTIELYIQGRYNKTYRKNLKYSEFSIVSSNCFGGIFYHWLNLKFNSPFINLWLSNEDFIKMIENWQVFLITPIIEDRKAKKPYPVGIGWGGIRLFFQHYNSFQEAVEKFEERKKRIIPDKTIFIMSNWDGTHETVEAFEKLDEKNKIIFTNENIPGSASTVPLVGYDPLKGQNVWHTKYRFGKRYIDTCNIIEYLNNVLSNSSEDDEKLV